MSVAYKSSGTLLNELITTNLKILNIGEKEEFVIRKYKLMDELEDRKITFDSHCQKWKLIQQDFYKLEEILTKLWWEQEVLYQAIKNNDMESGEVGVYQLIAQAGIDSLKLNKERSDLTRKIDTLLGEESSTVLEKSWK